MVIQNSRRGCLYEIVIMSLYYFNVCFQTVKLQKHLSWEEAKLPRSFKLGWDHCWQSGCAKVFPIQKEHLVLSLMKQQPISDRSKWIFFIFGTKIQTTLLQNIWDCFTLAEQQWLTLLAS